MVLQDRNQRIRNIHEKFPEWTYEEIADLVGVSRQRVHAIVRQQNQNDIISVMQVNVEQIKLDPEVPISATQASKITGLPYYVFEKWVRRGLVEVVSRPDHATWGKPVLLNPKDLQKRIDRYRPRQKKQRTPA